MVQKSLTSHTQQTLICVLFSRLRKQKLTYVTHTPLARDAFPIKTTARTSRTTSWDGTAVSFVTTPPPPMDADGARVTHTSSSSTAAAAAVRRTIASTYLMPSRGVVYYYYYYALGRTWCTHRLLPLSRRRVTTGVKTKWGCLIDLVGICGEQMLNVWVGKCLMQLKWGYKSNCRVQ